MQVKQPISLSHADVRADWLAGLESFMIEVGHQTQLESQSVVCWFPQTSLQCLATAVPSGCSLLASAVPTTARTFRRGSFARSHSTSTRVT